MLGVGGSAATCSHAVNDFQKIACIQAQAPFENVSELAISVNDEGWAMFLAEWRKTSHLQANNMLIGSSVGDGGFLMFYTED